MGGALEEQSNQGRHAEHNPIGQAEKGKGPRDDASLAVTVQVCSRPGTSRISRGARDEEYVGSDSVCRWE